MGRESGKHNPAPTGRIPDGPVAGAGDRSGGRCVGGARRTDQQVLHRPAHLHQVRGHRLLGALGRSRVDGRDDRGVLAVGRITPMRDIGAPWEAIQRDAERRIYNENRRGL